jgi:NADH:ubiquinone oxidoreductase subunit 6 (subunit J)
MFAERYPYRYPVHHGGVITVAGSELILFIVLGVAETCLAISAVLLNNLVRCIVAYALSSACLAALFFLLGSPYASAFELTVGAGLISVLFLVALILSGGEELEVPA